jgi:hypothetical protein
MSLTLEVGNSMSATLKPACMLPTWKLQISNIKICMSTLKK